ncbi:MAG: F0F1 ATP synthase subunit A [Patescibacteria group bacterium]|nr:F0F1 ATP synthase subunit A [Patescibacteria group bacterium]
MKLEISIAPEAVFHIGSFPVTNSFLLMIGVTLFLIVCVIVLNKKIRMVPKGFQNLVEMLFEGALDFVDTIMLDKEKSRKVFPFVFSLFIFILVANLVNFIPGQSALTINEGGKFVPVLRGVMADYGMVFVLTMISFITVQVVGVMMCGPFGYLGKFFNFHSPIKLFVGMLELVGEFAKILSLSFRLFGNIFAGEVLLSVFLFLFPFLLPLPFLALELITAVIQAFVFAVLTLVFIKMAGETAESH